MVSLSNSGLLRVFSPEAVGPGQVNIPAPFCD